MKRLAAGYRLALGMLLGLSLAVVSGCSAEAWGSRQNAKAGGYSAVVAGMTEAEVLQAMGEPNSRSTMNLEGSGPRANVLRYLGHNQLVHIFMVEGKVYGKQKF
ncbi:MAG: hypothetical protein C0483_26335 [Pirellula sp.]|nr:hypothetical protein [Pirellula sp.]